MNFRRRKQLKLTKTIQNGNRHRASASKTDLLMECQYWASPLVEVPREPEDVLLIDDAPRFGIGFHECMELFMLGHEPNTKIIAEKLNLDSNRLYDFFRRGSEAATKLLRDRGWEHHPKIVEKKIAYDPFSDKSRFLVSDKTRDYSEKTQTELPGTVDLVLFPATENPIPVVIDWKSGQTSYDAYKNPQMRSLGLGISRLRASTEGVIVILFRIDDDFIEPNEAFLSHQQLQHHQVVLRNRFRSMLSKTPALRPGMHCKWCPALEVCPAHAGPMSLGDTPRMMEREQAAFTYSKLLAAEKLLEKVRSRVSQFVEANGPIELDNGKWLDMKTVTRENISKASIIRAKGKVEGEELIEKLRQQGIIEELKYKQLDPSANPAGRR